MHTKTITIGKEIKKGMPNYSNVTASMYMTVEFGEDEQVTSETLLHLWDKINREVSLQTELGPDPSWMMNTKEHKNYYTTTIKTPKTS